MKRLFQYQIFLSPEQYPDRTVGDVGRKILIFFFVLTDRAFSCFSIPLTVFKSFRDDDSVST